MRRGIWTWLGRVPYRETAALQQRLREGVLSGRHPEVLLLLEHDPVITLGRSADRHHILVSDDELRRRGVEVVESTRGGDVTYHGPGQLVGYPIVRLQRGVLAHVEGMAAGLSAVLREQQVEAHWKREVPGLWVSRTGPSGRAEREAKLCAFGVHVHRRVTAHGFALNVSTDLDAFRLIVPCGLDAGVTSVQQLTGHAPPLSQLAERVAQALSSSLGVRWERDCIGDLDS